jgi:hypothetical protein
MKAKLFRTIAVFLILLSVASIRGMGQPIAAKTTRAEPLKPEPLRPFSEIEALLLRGALIAASVPVIWFTVVWIRGALRDRRQKELDE